MNNQDNQDNQINNNYTGGATKQETEDAFRNLVIDMEKYVFDEQFNEKFPKNLEALVQYFTDTIKDTSNIETINNYMTIVRNINNVIKTKLDNPESTDADIINFAQASTEDSNTSQENTTTNEQNIPQQESSFQKMKNIGTNLGTSISKSASNLTRSVKNNAVNLSETVKTKASQVGTAVSDGINTLSNTSNISGKLVVTNEAVTLGSIITGIALMAPFLIVGGSKKRKNIQKKKYTKRKNIQKKNKNKIYTKKRKNIQKKKRNYKKTKKQQKLKTATNLN
jgi:hypothetical protein